MHLPNPKAASLLALSTAASLVSGLGQKPIVSFTKSPDSFQIAGGPVSAGQIRVSSNDYWGVIRAAGDLAVDFGRVTGTNYTLSNGVKGSAPASYVYNPVNNMNNTFVSASPSPLSLPLLAGRVYPSADRLGLTRYNSTKPRGPLPSPAHRTRTRPRPTSSSLPVPLAIRPWSTS